MNVKQLRALLDHLPADALVLVPSHDHSYREASGAASTALRDKQHRTWTEDYGEDTTPEAEYGERLQVLIIGE